MNSSHTMPGKSSRISKREGFACICLFFMRTCYCYVMLNVVAGSAREYIYIYIYIHIHIHIYTHMSPYIQDKTEICVYMHIFVCGDMKMCIRNPFTGAT
jgi:hypothetical protein